VSKDSRGTRYYASRGAEPLRIGGGLFKQFEKLSSAEDELKFHEKNFFFERQAYYNRPLYPNQCNDFLLGKMSGRARRKEAARGEKKRNAQCYFRFLRILSSRSLTS
jgi:hypothetical protein